MSIKKAAWNTAYEAVPSLTGSLPKRLLFLSAVTIYLHVCLQITSLQNM